MQYAALVQNPPNVTRKMTGSPAYSASVPFSSAASFIGVGYLKDSMTKSSCEIVGQIYKKGEKPGEGVCVDK